MSSHKPRKRFGQNFLIDQHAIHRIIQAIDPKPRDHVIEIGPGQGALTNHLIQHDIRLDIVEIDNDLAAYLTETLKPFPHVTLYHHDALQFDFGQLCSESEPARIVGNLPYNISTPLIFHLLRYERAITDMVFMLQKEVVARMAATKGDSAYGRLSVMVQYYCEVDPLFVIKPGAFFPPPKVDSQIVRLRPHRNKTSVATNEALFAHIVMHAFSQRRKTIKNALKKVIPECVWEESHWDISLRPENFGMDDYVFLSNLLDNYQRGV